MLTIFRRRPIEIDCYVTDAEGEPVAVPADEVEATLVGPVHKLKLTNITLVTQGGRDDKPYYRIVTQNELNMFEPGVYSMRLKISNKKNKLNEMFSLTTYPGDDNTGLPAGETVRLNVFVKEATGTWSGEIVMNSGIDGIQVNGELYRPRWGIITLPDYPEVSAVVVDAEHVTEPTNGVFDLSPALFQGIAAYVDGASYKRGDLFYVVNEQGYRTAYRVISDFSGAARSGLPFGKLERLTMAALSNPLDIGTLYIINNLN